MNANSKNFPVYINPLTDFGFKRIFGSEEHKDILIAFLNACLADETGPITDIAHLPTEQLGNAPNEKSMVYDIYCTNQKGERFIIAMQKGRQDYFSQRAIAYACRTVSASVEKGEHRYRYPRVYSINLLDFNAVEFQHSQEFFWKVKLKDDKNDVFSDKITLVFVELRKFAVRMKDALPASEAEKWFYYLKMLPELAPEQLPQAGSTLAKMVELCKYEKLKPMEKQEYEKSILEYEDVQDAIGTAFEDGEAKGWEKGIEAGIAQGWEKGIEQGEAQGWKKGIKEGIKKGEAQGWEKAQCAIAQQMLLNGLDIDMIRKITGIDLS